MTRALSHGIPQSDYRLLHPEKVRGKVILALRTDKPEAELYLYKDKVKIAEVKWEAHRELSNTIHTKIKEILNPGTKISKLHNPITDCSARDLVRGKHAFSLEDIDGIVCFEGPGSFTGLRIGLSVANALAYSYNIPIVARGGEKWLKDGINDLLAGTLPAGGSPAGGKIALPKYDRPAATTPPRK